MAPFGTEPLPARLTPLVGHRDDLSAVVRMLAESPLVTLMDPSTGKTQLALARSPPLGHDATPDKITGRGCSTSTTARRPTRRYAWPLARFASKVGHPDLSILRARKPVG